MSRLSRLRAACLAASLAAGGALSIGDASAQQPSGVQVSQRSSFYRLTVNTAYRGEKLTIDVVVACRVRITNSRLTGQSFDAFWFPSPLWALRMKDGKAVAVQTPDACNGETSDDGRVPPDFPRDGLQSINLGRSPTAGVILLMPSPTPTASSRPPAAW